jgi:hypothetical protein
MDAIGQLHTLAALCSREESSRRCNDYSFGLDALGCLYWELSHNFHYPAHELVATPAELVQLAKLAYVYEIQ